MTLRGGTYQMNDDEWLTECKLRTYKTNNSGGEKALVSFPTATIQGVPYVLETPYSEKRPWHECTNTWAVL